MRVARVRRTPPLIVLKQQDRRARLVGVAGIVW